VSAESNDLGKRASTKETESLDVVKIPNEKSDFWWQFGQQQKQNEQKLCDSQTRVREQTSVSGMLDKKLYVYILNDDETPVLYQYGFLHQ